MSSIQVRRGTNADRGAYASGLSGEPMYATDTKALFIADGSTTGGVPATVPASILNAYNGVSQDINALATDNLVDWTIQSPAWGTDITHDTGSDPHKITFATAGTYELTCTVAVDATASTPTRWNGIMRFKVNNATEIGPQGKGGYIRETGGQDETSLHITTFAYTFSAADYIWVKIDREATTTDAVDTTARACVIYIKRIA